MLQQTRVATAIPYYKKFLKTFPDLNSLANALPGKVLKCWEGLGYYSRARHLHSAAKEIQVKYVGKFPQDYHELLSLPGIGEYTASAVASIAFGKPFPVVDGNVWRVFSRILALPLSPSNGKKKISGFLKTIIPHEDPATFNQAIMELGSLVCTPESPACSWCPVQSFCRAFRQKKVDMFPVKPEKKKIPHESWGVLLVTGKGKILLRQRPSSGLWGGLWEFPGVKLAGQEKFENFAGALLKKLGLESKNGIQKLEPVRHTFSHFKLTIFPCLAEVAKPARLRGFVWANLANRQYPMPAPYLRMIQAIVSLLKPISFKAARAR